jgi:hypothetical protein
LHDNGALDSASLTETNTVNAKGKTTASIKMTFVVNGANLKD